MNLNINPDKKTARTKTRTVQIICHKSHIDGGGDAGIDATDDGSVFSSREVVLVSTLVTLIDGFRIWRSIAPGIQTRQVHKLHRPPTLARRNQPS